MDEVLKNYRKINIIISTATLIVIFIFAIIFIKIHFDANQKEIIKYEDSNTLSYKVLLKENDYFDDLYVEQENQYISRLINNISADFGYEFELPEDVSYDYDYSLTLVADVSDSKTGKTIYSLKEPLKAYSKSGVSGKLVIDEPIEIDYNKYNDLITRFVTQYELKNVNSNLQVRLNVDVSESNKKFAKQGIASIGLNIPLTENTVSIDTDYGALGADKFFELDNEETNNKWLIAGIFLSSVGAIGSIALIIYARKTETEEDKYRSEVKKIVNTYDGYISKIQDEFNMDGYQILKVASFADLLEIRDTMHVPIIMLGNDENLTTCFMIPATNNILYIFTIGVTQYALPTGDRVEKVSVSVSSDEIIGEEKSEEDEQIVQ